jgi:hypothetical protein
MGLVPHGHQELTFHRSNRSKMAQAHINHAIPSSFRLVLSLAPAQLDSRPERQNLPQGKLGCPFACLSIRDNTKREIPS